MLGARGFQLDAGVGAADGAGACEDLIRLSLPVRRPNSGGGREQRPAMPGTKIGPRLGPNASERRNDAQIRRAAKRAGWAGEALESAADDLDGACGAEGNPLTGLQEA